MIFSVPPYTSPGKESFAYWEDFLTEEELNYLSSNNYWSDAKPALVGGSSGGSRFDPAIRETGVSWLQVDPQNKEIWEKIAKVVAHVNASFFRFDLTGFYEPMQLGVYSAQNGGHYGWHIDASSRDRGVPRKLSMAMLLSDTKEFTGGELQLKIDNNREISVEQKRGRAWFFPSYVLHQVTPVLSGVRKSAVLWVGGPEFK